MTAALDLGSSEFRSLRLQDHRLIARRLPAVYAVLEDRPAQRRVLELAGLPFSTAGDQLVIIGDAAREVSRLLSRPIVPLLAGGRLPDRGPVARQVCAWLIDLLLPSAVRDGERCFLAVPRCGIDDGTSRYLEHVVQLKRYQTTVMHPAAALALAELESHAFTGACLTVGSESIGFAVTHLSIPIVTGRLKTGTREVLERFAHFRKAYLWDPAGNVYLDLPAVQTWLDSGNVQLTSPGHDDEAWVADAFGEMLLTAWFGLKRQFLENGHPILQEQLPLVVSGGTARLPGFLDQVCESLRLSGVPLQVGEVRSAAFEPYSVARGLLIQATLASGEPVDQRRTERAA